MKAFHFSSKNSIWIYLFISFSWALCHSLLLHYLGLSWEISIVDSAINTAFLSLISASTYNALNNYLPSRSNSFYLVIWTITLALISALGSHYLLKQFILLDQYESFLEKSLPIRICIDFLLLGVCILSSWLLNTIKAQDEALNRKAKASRLMKEAELNNLRQQLQPHFLFNSLNSINALIVIKPEEARQMIQKLSDFLRGSLRKDDLELIAFSEELQHLQLYLDIEKVRFGNRLNIEITDLKTSELKLPPLLLQPIVENAIKFGLYDTTETITIKIKTTFQNNNLVIEIENPFDPNTAKSAQGTGFGLSSIHRRLYLIFGRKDLLETQINNAQFITTLTIPQS